MHLSSSINEFDYFRLMQIVYSINIIIIKKLIYFCSKMQNNFNKKLNYTHAHIAIKSNTNCDLV
jgi:hypothetical protein